MEDVAPGALTGPIGYMFTDNFGIEGEVGFGIRGDYNRLEGDDGGNDTFSISATFKF